MKNHGRLTSCCCCQVIELALERRADSLFRRPSLGGRGGGGGIVLGVIKDLAEAQGGLCFFVVEGT